jgi:orotidine-5'-phosphate decarboxylase
MKNISNKTAIDKLIFALDAYNYEEALSWVELLSGHVGMFKVGKELFTAVGPKIIESIKKRGQKVFLDVRLNVDMFNVHASGGSQMIKEAVSAAWACADKLGQTRPILLAVTVLTSLNSVDLTEIGFQKDTKELVFHLAKLAQTAGASGVVASAQDIALLRTNFGDKFVIVTPGIRSASSTINDDQKRTLSAYEAVKTGADYIVVGRPIRAAHEPLEACGQIVQEIAEGLAAR